MKDEMTELTIPQCLNGIMQRTTLYRPTKDNLALMTWLIMNASRYDDHKKEWVYANLSHEWFGRYIRRKDVKRLKEKLLGWGIIESDSKWNARGRTTKSIGYRLTQSAHQSPSAKYSIEERKLRPRRKTAPATLRKHKTGWRPVHEKLERDLQSLTIVREFAQPVIDTAETEAKRKRRETTVEAIENGVFFASRCQKTRRFFTNVVLMNKELRPALRLNGRPLFEIDVKSSQPTLFLCQLSPSILTLPDASLFKELCLTGNLYAHLMEKAKLQDLTKDEFKDEYFFKMWYGPTPTEEKQSELDRVMSAQFPNVYEEIRKRKHEREFGCYKWFSIDLQKLESTIIIERVCDGLYEQFPDIALFTVHDAILSTEEWLNVIEREIENVFLDIAGFKPALRRTPLFKCQEAPPLLTE